MNKGGGGASLTIFVTDCSLDYIKVEGPQLIFKCLNCNKDYKKDFNKELINRLLSTYKFSNENINIFILLLRKGVYPYEYMDSWERFGETSLPNKDFYSCLNMKDITDIDYRHTKRVFKELEMDNLGDYHDLIAQSNTILLADIFENFRNKCIETYELDAAYFLSAPGLTYMARFLKKDAELELLTDPNILLMFEEGIRGEITQSSHRYAEANNKYMQNYDRNKESSYLMYLDANNFYGWAMSQKQPVGIFKWVKNVSKTGEEFVKNYDNDCDIGFILKVVIEYPKELHDLHIDLPFLPERMKINKCNKFALYMIKKLCCSYKKHKTSIRAWSKLKKVRDASAFCQEAWFEPYIDMNKELKKKQKK